MGNEGMAVGTGIKRCRAGRCCFIAYGVHIYVLTIGSPVLLILHGHSAIASSSSMMLIR
jgi:hypothetical protein